MEINLRPLTLGEILDRTAQLYRAHFWLFAGISAVYSGALLALSLLEIGVQELFRAAHLASYLIWVGGIGIMVQFLIMFLFGGLAVAANNRAVAWVHLGEPATIRGAYGSILPHAGRYLWLMTIIAVIIWTPLALAYGGYLSLLFFWIRPLARGAMRNLSTNPAVAAGNQQATLMLGLATATFGLVFLLAVAYAVVMGLRYSLSIAASVVENLKARQALRRSIDLSKEARGRIFVLALLVITLGVPLRSANVESMPYYVFLAATFLLGFLLWRTPRERYSTKFVSLFGWLPVTLGSASYIFWYWYAAGSEVDTAFFHVAGDVLPVFLLATIVDARRTNELEGKQLVLPIAAVIIGEFSALDTLAFPTGDLASQFAVVSSSLVTAIVALLLAVMADIARPFSREHEKTREARKSTELGQRNTLPVPGQRK